MAPGYVLDACVLHPVVLRDLLLTLATLDVFQPRWTDEIIDETTRNMPADHPDIDGPQFAERGVGVTYDVRDFDGEQLRQHEIAVVMPPQLIGQLVADEPSVVGLLVD